MGFDDEEQILRDLQKAVARVSAAMRAKTIRREVLIALTSPEDRAMAHQVAGAFGFQIFRADDAAEAAASVAGRRFDLILLDPADAGRWTRRIRSMPETGAAPAI